MNDKIISIIGPTAIGKTAIAIQLAQQLNGEVIGLDSRQIYYGMEIGTAQPNQFERKGIPHHLIGIRSSDKAIAAGEYAQLVKAVILDVKQRNRTPIICGGAGLYYRALREGIFEESDSNALIRNKLEMEYDNDPQNLLNQLTKIDPEYSKIVHINNKKRLVRALEIFEITGKTPSEQFLDQKANKRSSLNLFSVFLKMERKLLIDRICKRTEQMLQNGLISEVKSLIEKYDIDKVHPLDSIGYKQVIAHLNGEINYQEMVEEINIKTRQYAKRQVAWFKNESVDLEIDLTNKNDINNIIKKIISMLNID